MKKIRWTGVLLLLALVLPQPATSEPNQGIDVRDADSTLEAGMSDPGVALPVAPRIIVEHANSSDLYSLLLMPEELRQQLEQVVPRIIVEHANSSDLHSLLLMPEELVLRLAEVVPRIVVEHANSSDLHALLLMPEELRQRLAEVVPRIVVEHANSTALRDLVEVPPELEELLDAVRPRPVVGYANSTRSLELGYPCSIFDDGAPPIISNVRAAHVTASSATIEWDTSERATSMVEYGTESGSYEDEEPETDDFVEQHAVTLTDLAQGTTHYFRVGGRDKCGNWAYSDEYGFTTMNPVYLPLVLKGS